MNLGWADTKHPIIFPTFLDTKPSSTPLRDDPEVPSPAVADDDRLLGTANSNFFPPPPAPIKMLNRSSYPFAGRRGATSSQASPPTIKIAVQMNEQVLSERTALPALNSILRIEHQAHASTSTPVAFTALTDASMPSPSATKSTQPLTIRRKPSSQASHIGVASEKLSTLASSRSNTPPSSSAGHTCQSDALTSENLAQIDQVLVLRDPDSKTPSASPSTAARDVPSHTSSRQSFASDSTIVPAKGVHQTRTDRNGAQEPQPDEPVHHAAQPDPPKRRVTFVINEIQSKQKGPRNKEDLQQITQFLRKPCVTKKPERPRDETSSLTTTTAETSPAPQDSDWTFFSKRPASAYQLPEEFGLRVPTERRQNCPNEPDQLYYEEQRSLREWYSWPPKPAKHSVDFDEHVRQQIRLSVEADRRRSHCVVSDLDQRLDKMFRQRGFRAPTLLRDFVDKSVACGQLSQKKEVARAEVYNTASALYLRTTELCEELATLNTASSETAPGAKERVLDVKKQLAMAYHEGYILCVKILLYLHDHRDHDCVNSEIGSTDKIADAGHPIAICSREYILFLRQLCFGSSKPLCHEGGHGDLEPDIRVPHWFKESDRGGAVGVEAQGPLNRLDEFLLQLSKKEAEWRQEELKGPQPAEPVLHEPNPGWCTARWQMHGGFFRCRTGPHATEAERACRLCYDKRREEAGRVPLQMRFQLQLAKICKAVHQFGVLKDPLR